MVTSRFDLESLLSKINKRQDFIIENLRVELDIIDTPEQEAQVEPVAPEEAKAA